jgi:hypothetical protein
LTASINTFSPSSSSNRLLETDGGIYKANMARAPTAPMMPEPIRAVGRAAPPEDVLELAVPPVTPALGELPPADVLCEPEPEDMAAVRIELVCDFSIFRGFRLVN